MPQKIQRVPRGLADLLSTFGGVTPQDIADQVAGVIELTQYYGLSQRTVEFTTAAATTNGNAQTMTLSATKWTVLFAAAATFGRTTTVTSLRGSVGIARGAFPSHRIFPSAELGPYGATVAGTLVVGGWLPYPLLCPPQTQVLGIVDSLGTDASVLVGLTAEFGILG